MANLINEIQDALRLASGTEVTEELWKVAREFVAYHPQFIRRVKEKNNRRRMMTMKYRRRNKSKIKTYLKKWRLKNKLQIKRRRTQRHLTPVGYKPGK